MSHTENKIDFEHDYADVNGVRIHYVSNGSGKLMLFVHGFPSFWYMWKEQLIEFGKDHLAVAMDMRGYNLSSKPEGVEYYQVKYLVEDIRALAVHLGHKKFTLIAHDWGGAVAWPFSSRYPEYIEKLIIVNAPHPNIFSKLLATNKEQQKASQYILDFQSTETERVLSMNNYSILFKTITTPQMIFTEHDKKMYYNAWSQPGALAGALNYYRAAILKPPEKNKDKSIQRESEDITSEVNVHVPTLVIWGEKDTALTIHNLEGIDKYVSDLTIKRIPDGSHWVVNEKPEMISSLIRDYINSA